MKSKLVPQEPITPGGRETFAKAQIMQLSGIGTLVEKGDIWRLTYAVCAHAQDLPRVGLEAEQAAEQVRTDYARCLMCGTAHEFFAAPRPKR